MHSRICVPVFHEGFFEASFSAIGLPVFEGTCGLIRDDFLRRFEVQNVYDLD